MYLATVPPDRLPRFAPAHGKAPLRPRPLQNATGVDAPSAKGPKRSDVVAQVIVRIGMLCEQMAD
jgi:hypothetical protein